MCYLFLPAELLPQEGCYKNTYWSDIKGTFSLTLVNCLRSISEIPFPPSSLEAGYVGIFPKTQIDKVIWSKSLISYGYQMERKRVVVGFSNWPNFLEGTV